MRVHATNSEGDRNWSEIASATASATNTAPGTPRNLTLLTEVSNQITVRWQPPASDGGAAISNYKAQYRATGTTDWNSVDTETYTSYNVGGLFSGTEYEVQVRAENSEGNSSWTMARATPVGPPSAPQNLTLTAGVESITASWDPPEDDGGSPIFFYVLQYRDTSTDWVSWYERDTGTSATIVGLTPDEAYEVRVRAINTSGKTGASGPYSDEEKEVPLAPPIEPEPPMVELTPGNGEITLTWTVYDNGADIDLYRLLYQPVDESEPVQRRNISPDDLDGMTYTLSGLTKGVEYEVQLKARNAGGFSEWSEAVSATPVGPPDGPTRLADEDGEEPTSFIAGVPQTFTLHTSEDTNLWVGVNYDDNNNLTTGSCPAGGNTGAHRGDGDTITIRGCYAGESEIRIYRGQLILTSYDVTVSSSGFTASLADASGNTPEMIEAGGSETFTLTTNVPDFVWVGVNYGGDNHLSTGSCPAGGNTGGIVSNGNSVTIHGCSVGTAEVRIYKGQLILNSSL